ncbi:MAG: hypothetical protein HY350_05200, partial [Candidatus Omnitrophica bacterium]|nr:hypothetical protein [Candidatus Omnitrophota bacterium]
MRKVASLVVLLYALIIIVLTIPVLFACFFPEIPASWIIKVFSQWIFWVWFALMLLCQVILLFVPLKIADGRPV